MDTKQIFLAEFTHRLQNAGLKFDLDEASITVHSNTSTPTIVRLEKVEYVGLDGTQISYSISISKRCLDPDRDLLDLNNLGRWNTLTSILSAIRDEEGLKVFARLNLYEGAPDVIKHVYAPLAFWAVWLAPGLAAYLEAGQPNAFGFICKVAPPVEPWWFGIPDDAAHELPPFSDADFGEGVSIARERGFLCNGGGDGLTVEFPWDAGARGALYDSFIETDSSDSIGKRTALLTIETGQPHPLFGKGTLVRLQVPVTTDPDEVADLVNGMNTWESEAADLTPFFGSWCIDRHFSSPAYVMFVPSMLGRTITIPSLIVWMHSRHRASMGYLKQIGLE